MRLVTHAITSPVKASLSARSANSPAALTAPDIPRHGASDRPTILIGAQDHLGELPFDFRPLRVMPYRLGANGEPDGQMGAALEDGLRVRLREALEGRAPVDNPIMHVTGWEPGGRLEQDKTDVFLDRVEFATELGARIEAARRRLDREQALAELREVEQILTDTPHLVTELHSSLLGVYLAYRDRKAYDRMVTMYPALPPELRATPVAIEQYALALNRLAEQTTNPGEVSDLRSQGLAALDGMDESAVTSETWGIRGRIHKSWYDEAIKGGRDVQARAMLGQAIQAYEAGVRADMRDYYPSVNAVTLRLVRDSPEDVAELAHLVPVVRAAVDYAPPARSDDERYWRTATRLELASAAKDWTAVEEHLTALLGLPHQPYMRETTIKNLRIQQRAYSEDPYALARIEHAISELAT